MEAFKLPFQLLVFLDQAVAKQKRNETEIQCQTFVFCQRKF